jgi:hypothetical protein
MIEEKPGMPGFFMGHPDRQDHLQNERHHPDKAAADAIKVRWAGGQNC